MSLKVKISEGLNSALKQKKELEVSALRMLNAAIINREKEKRYKISRQKAELKEKEAEKESRLEDKEIIEVIFSEIKKRKKAILEFEKGKRPDLAEKEKKEIGVFQRYLPRQFSEEEIKKLAKETIKKVGAKEPKDKGRVMAELISKAKGNLDGGLASKIVGELLGSE
jgi:hypothetical protein